MATDATTMPSVIGIMTVPELVAEAPCAPCRKSGMNWIAPNMAKPRVTVTSDETRKTELRNNASGITASSPARRAAQTKTPMNVAASTKASTTRTSPQAYWLPPQEKPSSRGTPAATTAPPPR